MKNKLITESRPVRKAFLHAILPSGVIFVFDVEWQQGWMSRKIKIGPDWTPEMTAAALEACRRFERELRMEEL